MARAASAHATFRRPGTKTPRVRHRTATGARKLTSAIGEVKEPMFLPSSPNSVWKVRDSANACSLNVGPVRPRNAA